jgi:hypothetical protein
MIQLGDIARDTITGFEGVVIGETNWLHGCRRLTLQPRKLHDGKTIDTQSFDEPQLKLVKRAAVPSTSRNEPALARTGGPQPEPTRRSDPPAPR